MAIVDKPSYPYDPFSSRKRLLSILKLTEKELDKLTGNPRRYYRPFWLIKPDGKRRRVYEVRAPLKSVQARICCLFLRSVRFPQYLQGGIKSSDVASVVRPN